MVQVTGMTTPRRGAVYIRISKDEKDGGLGVARQELLCRDLADRLGWTVAETYVDNDVSAYSGRARPAYERMMADLAAGRRDGVLVVDTDRLTRQPAELEEFIALADSHGVALANAAGDVDLSTSDGRFKARIMGAVARQESEKKAERIRRQREQAAQAGRPMGGPRPYGYAPDGMTMIEHEAANIQEAARRFLAGEGLRKIAMDWNAEGIPSATGRQWTVQSLRKVLANPRYAALRVHRGEVIGGAVWPAVLDRATHERLVAQLGNPRVRRAGRPPTNLLTGLIYCGRCGYKMASMSAAGHPRRYSCRPQPGRPGCGKVAISARIEDRVRDDVLAALAGPRLAKSLRAVAADDDEAAHLAAQLRDDERSLEELSEDFYVNRLISRAEFLGARRALEDRITGSRRGLARGVDQGVLADLSADEDALRASWDAHDVDWRRAVLIAVVDRVDIAPSTRGRVYDPDRVSIVWRA